MLKNKFEQDPLVHNLEWVPIMKIENTKEILVLRIYSFSQLKIMGLRS